MAITYWTCLKCGKTLKQTQKPTPTTPNKCPETGGGHVWVKQ